MGSKADDDGEIQPAEEMPRHSRLKPFVVTMVILLAVAYVAALLASRTEGFRSYVTERLGDRLGTAITVSKVHATPRLDLVFEDVASEGERSTGSAGFKIGKLKIDWSLASCVRARGFRPTAVAVDRAGISFAPGARGEWEPAAFAAVGETIAGWAAVAIEPGAGGEGQLKPAFQTEDKAASGIPPEMATGGRLTVRDSEISWWSVRGDELASVGDLRLTVTPVRAPKREMTHYRLEIGYVRTPGAAGRRDYVLELLDTGGYQVVLACEAGGARRRRGETAPAVVGGASGGLAEYVRFVIEEAPGPR